MNRRKVFDWKTIGMVFAILAITSITFLLANKAFKWFDFDQLKTVEPATSESATDTEETANYIIDYSTVEQV